MSKHFSTIVVCVIAIMQSMLSAQTPHDSFHPETSRPMLRLERDTAWRQQIEDDSGSFLIVANHNSGIVMLYDLSGDSLVAVADINHEVKYKVTKYQVTVHRPRVVDTTRSMRTTFVGGRQRGTCEHRLIP